MKNEKMILHQNHHQLSTLDHLLIQSAQELKLNLNQEILSSSESSNYISKLASLPLSKLNSEPSELQFNQNNLDSDLSLLCFREFRTFLLAHDASIAIKRTFNQLHLSLDQLLQDTLKLNSIIHEFPNSVQNVLHDRKQMNLLLHHLTPIEDLLDLPQLVSTCVNARLWNEAIELAIRVRQLDTQLSLQDPHSSSGVLHQIRSEVDQALKALRDNLINTLRDRGLKFPSAVRTIAILRRMSNLSSDSIDSPSIESLTETELRITFLASRWSCLANALQQVQLSTGFSPSSALSSTSNPLHLEQFSDASLQYNEDRLKFLRKWLEIWRELVGDTISIYHEIFLKSTNQNISTLKINSDHPLSNPTVRSSPAFFNDKLSPLNFFATQATHLLISTLTHHVKLLVTISSLSSLLTQLSYCAAAFSKWGMDFTSTIRPTFINTLEEIIKLRMESGLKQFQVDLKPITIQTPTSSSFNKTVFQTRRRSLHPPSTQSLEHRLIAPDTLRQVLSIDLSLNLPSSSPSRLPSHLLTLFPPLARFLNSQFTALNELRLLPIIESYPKISSYQLQILTSINEELRKLSLSLPPPSPLHSGFSNNSEHLQSLIKEDHGGSASPDQLREIVHRLIWLWSKHVLPMLEHSLRVEIYGDLKIKKASDEFSSLLEFSESILSSLSHTPKAEVIVLDKPRRRLTNANDQLNSPSDSLKSPLTSTGAIPEIITEDQSTIPSSQLDTMPVLTPEADPQIHVNLEMQTDT
ncbi:Dor1-like family-domain-containing protein [Melampsora americana]|nr:Dor1-like family-domain-containing protein [Melampsora americana]